MDRWCSCFQPVWGSQSNYHCSALFSRVTCTPTLWLKIGQWVDGNGLGVFLSSQLICVIAIQQVLSFMLSFPYKYTQHPLSVKRASSFTCKMKDVVHTITKKNSAIKGEIASYPSRNWGASNTRPKRRKLCTIFQSTMKGTNLLVWLGNQTKETCDLPSRADGHVVTAS